MPYLKHPAALSQWACQTAGIVGISKGRGPDRKNLFRQRFNAFRTQRCLIEDAFVAKNEQFRNSEGLAEYLDYL